MSGLLVVGAIVPVEAAVLGVPLLAVLGVICLLPGWSSGDLRRDVALILAVQPGRECQDDEYAVARVHVHRTCSSAAAGRPAAAPAGADALAR